MAGIDLEISLTETVTAALERLIASGTDMTPVMKDIAGHLADTTRERFETGIDASGQPFTPSRRAIEQGGKTLVERGDLLGSIAEDWGSNYAAAGPEASGGAAVYALIHQTGGTIRPKTAKALSFRGGVFASVTMPKREYLGFDDENGVYVVDSIAGYLGRALDGGAGGGGATA